MVLKTVYIWVKFEQVPDCIIFYGIHQSLLNVDHIGNPKSLWVFRHYSSVIHVCPKVSEPPAVAWPSAVPSSSPPRGHSPCRSMGNRGCSHLARWLNKNMVCLYSIYVPIIKMLYIFDIQLKSWIRIKNLSTLKRKHDETIYANI